jgi:hypothetical protein
MERATYTTKSFIIALALVCGRITAEQAALASQVEVASQIERWGEVEDCAYVHRFVNLRGLTLYIQPTTLTIMTCDGTSAVQLVYWLLCKNASPRALLLPLPPLRMFRLA